MKFQEIHKRAKGMDIKTHRIKKTDVIRMIQKRENNIDCYGTDRVGHCQEETCLWRSDCLVLGNGRR